MVSLCMHLIVLSNYILIALSLFQLSMNYHPYLYPPVDVDRHDGSDQQTVADEDELWGGPAPPSPFVVHPDPLSVGGQLTPPPSPPRHANAMQFADPHAPCPATPQFVPSSVDFDELQWASTFNVGNALSGPSTSTSNSSGQRNFMPLGELNHYTSFAPPATYGTSNDLGYTAQHEVPPVSGNDYEGFEVLYQALLLQVQTTPTPNPILMILKRAQLDEDGFEDHPLTTIACGGTRGIFDMTDGRPAPTGNSKIDNQTHDFYSIRPHQTLLRETDAYFSYYYSVLAVFELQTSLVWDWSMVFPEPMLPVLIRSNDIIGPHNLRPKRHGFAYVVPTEDSIWGRILERGIDFNYRPIANPDSVSVVTGIWVDGSAIYHPEHLVASQFAVNVFVELPTKPGRDPTAEYIGAYVLRVADDCTMSHTIWRDIAPEVQRTVYDRAPHLFNGLEHPSQGCPCLPFVDFHFYKWDDNIVGLVDSINLKLKVQEAAAAIALREAAGIVDEDVDLEYDDDDYYSEATHTDTDSGFDTDSGSEVGEDNELTPATVYSPGKTALDNLLARQT